MSMKSKFKRYFTLDDDVEETHEYVDYPEEEEKGMRQTRSFNRIEERGEGTNESSKNVLSLQSVQKSAKMILLEPRTYEEAQEIADHLKKRKAVVINLQRIAKEQALRIVDFLSGTVYAIGGDIQKLGPSIFLCTPDNVEITGSISDLLQNESNYERM
ncbi:cell division protein SepF [Shouchella shacheensis]|uniref:cell division protein SepF n=1 Tax=Shouchella shacheensis TaxID=1649580 RepID=UPI00074031A1|nr:cell division protein SepF [Shouchella shacheensis]